MEIPIVLRYELQSLISKYNNLNDKLQFQKIYIDSLQKINCNNTSLSINRLEVAIREKNILFLEMCKSVRATFLYLNRKKKLMFGFNNKSLKFWQISSERKKHLIHDCQGIIDNNEYNEDIRKYLVLTIKTLKKYDENYGMKIGLVLNRLFCRDISWTIYEYL